jgi:hypothetical protein
MHIGLMSYHRRFDTFFADRSGRLDGAQRNAWSDGPIQFRRFSTICGEDHGRTVGRAMSW